MPRQRIQVWPQHRLVGRFMTRVSRPVGAVGSGVEVGEAVEVGLEHE